MIRAVKLISHVLHQKDGGKCGLLGLEILTPEQNPEPESIGTASRVRGDGIDRSLAKIAHVVVFSQHHLQRLPKPPDQLRGGVHCLPVQHHRQRGVQHVVRLCHGERNNAQQVSCHPSRIKVRRLSCLNTRSRHISAVRTCRTRIWSWA